MTQIESKMKKGRKEEEEEDGDGDDDEDAEEPKETKRKKKEEEKTTVQMVTPCALLNAHVLLMAGTPRKSDPSTCASLSSVRAT